MLPAPRPREMPFKVAFPLESMDNRSPEFVANDSVLVADKYTPLAGALEVAVNARAWTRSLISWAFVCDIFFKTISVSLFYGL